MYESGNVNTDSCVCMRHGEGEFFMVCECIPAYKVSQWNVGWKALWPGAWCVCEFNCATTGNCSRSQSQSQSQSPWKPFTNNIWVLYCDKNYIYKWLKPKNFHLQLLGHWIIQREYRWPLGWGPIEAVGLKDPVLWHKWLRVESTTKHILVKDLFGNGILALSMK